MLGTKKLVAGHNPRCSGFEYSFFLETMELGNLSLEYPLRTHPFRWLVNPLRASWSMFLVHIPSLSCACILFLFRSLFWVCIAIRRVPFYVHVVPVHSGSLVYVLLRRFILACETLYNAAPSVSSGTRPTLLENKMNKWIKLKSHIREYYRSQNLRRTSLMFSGLHEKYTVHKILHLILNFGETRHIFYLERTTWKSQDSFIDPVFLCWLLWSSVSYSRHWAYLWLEINSREWGRLSLRTRFVERAYKPSQVRFAL